LAETSVPELFCDNAEGGYLAGGHPGGPPRRAFRDAGHLSRVLLSQDVFIKMMLTRYGGNGYAFVQRHFLPRCQRHGMGEASRDMLDDNQSAARVRRVDFMRVA
jgi:Phosphotriesterase family